MLDLIQQLIYWVHHHPQWAALFSFLIAFIESVAIIGLVIPGSTILVLMGGLIGAHILPLTTILIAAIVGAISGDALSYWLGLRYHQRIRLIWPFSRFTSAFNKGENFFVKHGGKSVFLGRFLGPLRPIIPIIAGMMKLKTSRFFAANIFSALIWAPGYVLLGVLIGNHVIAVSPHHAGKILAKITIVLLLLWVLYWLLRSVVLQYIAKSNRYQPASRQALENLLLKAGLSTGRKSPDNQQSWLALGVLISSAAFLVLFAVLALQPSLVIAFNLSLHHLLLSLHSPVPDGFMIVITQLGEKTILLPAAALIWLYFMQQKQIYLAWHWLALMFITLATFTLFKYLAHFPRPTDLAMTPSEYSFPSEHVGMALTFWGFLAFIFSQHSTKLNHSRWLEAAVSLMVIVVAFSRLYLGVHWFTDVIGALLLGLSCLSIIVLSYCRKPITRALSLQPLATLVLASFILLTGLFLYRHFIPQYHHFQKKTTPAFSLQTIP